MRVCRSVSVISTEPLTIVQSIIEQEGDGSSLPIPSDGSGPNWDQPLLIAEPEIQKLSIQDNDQFLLLACDGLFDVFTPEEVVTFVRTNMEKHGDTQRCCQVCCCESPCM